MKGKIWVLILIAGMILSACDDGSKGGGKDCMYKGKGGHGIIDDGITNGATSCGGTGCVGPQDYRTNVNAFPKPIYRVGVPFDGVGNAATEIETTYSNLGEDQKGLDLTIYIAKDGDQNQSSGILRIPVGNVNKNNLELVAHPTSNHLGIAESCLGSDRAGAAKCGLEDHRNATQKTAFHAPVYRYGKLSNYNILDPKEIEKTIDKIISGFSDIKAEEAEGSYPDGTYDAVWAAVGRLCVTKAANGMYTWDGTTFGADPQATGGYIGGRLSFIVDKTSGGYPLSNAGPVANLTQLQPAGNIRLADGKRKTEKLPVIAGGADKDPKVNTVAQNFKLNRQASARNNRNVKTQWSANHAFFFGVRHRFYLVYHCT